MRGYINFLLSDSIFLDLFSISFGSTHQWNESIQFITFFELFSEISNRVENRQDRSDSEDIEVTYSLRKNLEISLSGS
jgi:hypothetical protein